MRGSGLGQGAGVGGNALVGVIEGIIAATGSSEAVMESSLRVGEVIDSRAAFSYRLDPGDGSAGGCVSDTSLLGDDLLDRVALNIGTCPIDGWHRDGNGDQVAVLSVIIDPADYRRSEHYTRIFGTSGVVDVMSIPFGSGGEVARVIACRDSEGFSDGEVEAARLLQPVLTGCLRQSRMMEQLRTDPLSEEAMRERGLTAREAEIFCRLASGKTSQAVGQELSISVRTVEKHVQNIYARIGARNRSEAISILLGKGASASAALVITAATVIAAG